MVVVTEGSYTRYAVHLTCRNMSRMSETECTVRMYQHKRTKTASDNEQCFFTLLLNGDCLGVTCIIGGFTLCFAQQILTFLGMTTA